MRSFCKRGITVSDVYSAYDRWRHGTSGPSNYEKLIRSGVYGNDECQIRRRMCRAIHTEIKQRKLKFPKIRYKDIVEPSNGKVRKIGMQSPKQQVADYLAVDMLQEMFDRHIGYFQTASLPGKGQVFAKRYLQRWVQKNKYYVKLDVRKYYPSVDGDMLLKRIGKYVSSGDVRYLVESIVRSYGRGLNIGSYLSQYLANWYLSSLYHHIEDDCYRVVRGKRKRLAKNMLFYMDDVVLMSNSKKDLKMAARDISRFARSELLLDVKPWKICSIYGEPLDMVGYRFYPNGAVSMRSGVYKRGRRAVKAYRMDASSLHHAYRVVSYNGFYVNSDSYIATRKNNMRKYKKMACGTISAKGA